MHRSRLPAFARDLKQLNLSGLMNDTTRCNALETLFRSYLLLSQRDELIAIYDESFLSKIPLLIATADKLDLRTTLVHLPYAQQMHLVRELGAAGRPVEVDLPTGLIAAMSPASGILNVVSGHPETTAVRRAIVNQPRNPNCRLAHVPDISDEILGLILETRLDEVVQRCSAVARAIGNAQEAVVETEGPESERYILSIKLGGWDNEPIISSGLISPGSWGNVPGGETFCCPRPDDVNGDICINGSVPGFRLGPGEDVVLNFRQGKLISWKGNPSSPAIEFFSREQREAERRSDENWNTFAELGIGLNSAVTLLNGNSLFDEKAAGTIHVAIGDNSAFGHDIISRVHHDLVTTSPTLTLGGKTLMSRGELLGEGLWIAAAETLLDETPLPLGATFYLRPSRVETQDGRVIRRLYSGHRVGYVEIAAAETTKELAQVCSELRTYGSVTVGDFLRNHPRFGANSTTDLLSILHHYRMLVFTYGTNADENDG
jgi:hypothetical protein